MYQFILVRLWNKQFCSINHARIYIRSWNQPVLSNEGQVSCSKQTTTVKPMYEKTAKVNKIPETKFTGSLLKVISYIALINCPPYLTTWQWYMLHSCLLKVKKEVILLVPWFNAPVFELKYQTSVAWFISCNAIKPRASLFTLAHIYRYKTAQGDRCLSCVQTCLM